MAQEPVGRSHESMTLWASWERGYTGVNGACVVVQAGSQDARGSGLLPVLTCKMTFRAMLRPFLFCSLSPQSICGMGEVGGWGHMVAYLSGGEQGRQPLIPFAPSLDVRKGHSSPLLEDGVKSQRGMGPAEHHYHHHHEDGRTPEPRHPCGSSGGSPASLAWRGFFPFHTGWALGDNGVLTKLQSWSHMT